MKRGRKPGNETPSITINQENIVNNKELDTQEPVLFLKSGVTDLRRGANKLFTDNITRIADNPFDGNIYAYSNKSKTTVKIVQKKPLGLSMTVMHYTKPVDWPDYQPPDKKGHIISMTGNEKSITLKNLGFDN